MNKAIIAIIGSLFLVGCNSSTTNSYVYIGDAAFKSAAVPAAMQAGLKTSPTDPTAPTNQGKQELSGAATNGTSIVIGVNSTTSKPVDVSPVVSGNTATVGKESTLKTAIRAGGAAVGTAATGGNPAGGAAGALLPEAAEAVKSVATQAIEAVKP
jgi:hypothetical protein